MEFSSPACLPILLTWKLSISSAGTAATILGPKAIALLTFCTLPDQLAQRKVLIFQGWIEDLDQKSLGF
ncbi:hypothetical protein L6164_023247 [Bauhinia variegata]|uniref:Uncharacterized protein n=1 Tax=Bauhinia variegata TaxID=167791 RepID=A0ACB9MJJ3_BAUVA|nr:hypothetical protein L6164_023247 [Bauhinia variegata]